MHHSHIEVQVLITLLRGLLDGGSCPVQELASKGYKVSYVQDPRDEYDFGVENLAVDLRNGLRLCKAMEALSGSSHLRHKQLWANTYEGHLLASDASQTSHVVCMMIDWMRGI